MELKEEVQLFIYTAFCCASTDVGPEKDTVQLLALHHLEEIVAGGNEKLVGECLSQIMWESATDASSALSKREYQRSATRYYLASDMASWLNVKPEGKLPVLETPKWWGRFVKLMAVAFILCFVNAYVTKWYPDELLVCFGLVTAYGQLRIMGFRKLSALLMTIGCISLILALCTYQVVNEGSNWRLFGIQICEAELNAQETVPDDQELFLTSHDAEPEPKAEATLPEKETIVWPKIAGQDVSEIDGHAIGSMEESSEMGWIALIWQEGNHLVPTKELLEEYREFQRWYKEKKGVVPTVLKVQVAKRREELLGKLYLKPGSGGLAEPMFDTDAHKESLEKKRDFLATVLP